MILTLMSLDLAKFMLILVVNIMPPMNRDNFTSFPVISCRTALCGTSSTVLNKSDEGRYSSFVSDFNDKVYAISPLSK